MERFRSSLRDSVSTRWAILLLIAFVQAANYYFYDAISPLKRMLEDNFNITSANYGLFVSAYSIPNTILLMAILGGLILDRLGIRRTGFLFVGLMAAGGLVTAYGASEYFSGGGFMYGFFNSFWTNHSPELKMMLVGRFIFGLGAETSIVVVSKVIVKWFKGKELALAFGVKIGLARAGSALALFYSAEIAENASHWTLAIWFAAILLLVALLAFLVYTIFDTRIDRQLNEKLQGKSAEQFNIADLKRLLLNKSFIYVTLLCVTFYSAVFPFQSFSPDFLFNKFGLSTTDSGKIASILYWVTMFATPFFGFIVDKYGKSATFMIFGSILLSFIHVAFALTYINPVIPLVLLGLAIALVPAAMWPSVAKIVDEKRIGTAYGAMFSIQNLGLALFPFLAGIIIDGTNRNAEDFMSRDQYIQVKTTMEFHAYYLDDQDDPIRNKDLLASLMIYQLPDTIHVDENKSEVEQQVEAYGNLIWMEYFQTSSNESGKFSGKLGMDSINEINPTFFNLDFDATVLQISSANKDLLFEIPADNFETVAGKMVYKIELPDESQLGVQAGDQILITLFDNIKNEMILKESQKAYFDQMGKLFIKLGDGKIIAANADAINWNDHIAIKVRTPLDYTFAILMFSMLGILGFIFALLLKREDKVAGYGLDLPSNSKS